MTPEHDPDRAIARGLRLREPPTPAVRLSRRSVAVASGAAALAVAGVVAWSLAAKREVANREEVRAAPAVQPRPPEQLAALPKDYADLPPGVPRLGPPLPGDLGRAILGDREAADLPEPTGPAPADAPAGAGYAAERARARTSRLFASGAGRNQAQAPEAIPAGAPGAPRSVSESAGPPAASSGWLLPAGTVIRAALVSGIRSELPGPVVGQVTEDVWDGISGATLLIPRGSRLLGAYDSRVAFGQDRVLVTWSRLVLPDGRSVGLADAAATDAAGFSGLSDRVDHHWRELIGASLVSLALAATGELGRRSEEGELAEALRRGLADTGARVGEQLVGRSLAVRPTLSVRPGHPVRVLLTADLRLPAWSGP